MGGTFMSLDIEYRDYFNRNLHDALSGFSPFFILSVLVGIILLIALICKP